MSSTSHHARHIDSSSTAVTQRIRAGLARARASGVRLGRPPTVKIDAQLVARLRRRGLSIRTISRRVGVPKSTLADFMARHCHRFDRI